jgi:hypothetical protein
VTPEQEILQKITEVSEAEERMLAANEMLAYHALAAQEAKLFDSLYAIWRERG